MMATPSFSFSSRVRPTWIIWWSTEKILTMPSPPTAATTMMQTMIMTRKNPWNYPFPTSALFGVDYGLACTGITITTGGYNPQLLTILSNYNSNSTELSTSIVDTVKSEQAQWIVLGLPLHKNGTDSEQSSITRDFGQVLLGQVRERCGKKINV